ncbi:MAG: ferrochelatase [Coriobacteriales bacterium]|jgi:ferrochelatase|nr:ferrochelatase [Coriobacteriales bacterium]
MNSESSIGILLVNTGTPDAPTKEAAVRYLRRFLTDRRIVNLPPLIWKPLLNGIVLRVRPEKTVRIYQRIWTPEGSPYTLHSQKIEQALIQEFNARGKANLLIRMAHRYGNPSMESELRSLQQQGCKRLIVLPLYPQRAFPTTDSVHDELTRVLPALGYAPDLTFIWSYFEEPMWIEAVANSIRPALSANSPKTHLLFSFHSEPLKDVRDGDPYREHVEKSVRAIATALDVPEDSYSIAYQSQFDDAQRWLGPFFHQKIAQLKAQDVEKLLIVCPGFAVDCTETLYDIEVHQRMEFANDFPGECFRYIPCLNEDSAHIKALAQVIEHHL